MERQRRNLKNGARRNKILLLSVIGLLQLGTITFIVERYEGYWPKYIILISIIAAIFAQFFDKKDKNTSIVFGNCVAILVALLFFLSAIVAAIPNPEIGDPVISSPLLVYSRYILITALSVIWLFVYFRNDK